MYVVRTYLHAYIYIHTYVHTYVHTYIHTYIHSCTYSTYIRTWYVDGLATVVATEEHLLWDVQDGVQSLAFYVKAYSAGRGRQV